MNKITAATLDWDPVMARWEIEYKLGQQHDVEPFAMGVPLDAGMNDLADVCEKFFAIKVGPEGVFGTVHVIREDKKIGIIEMVGAKPPVWVRY